MLPSFPRDKLLFQITALTLVGAVFVDLFIFLWYNKRIDKSEFRGRSKDVGKDGQTNYKAYRSG